jgi:ATP-dependent DNA helicase RecQ
MLALAERRACRHQSLVKYLGETIEGCGGACDVCGGFDLLEDAQPARRAAVAIDGDGQLFAELRALRRRLADARGLPAFLVFSDAVLLRMAEARPRTASELLAVPGVGPKKMALYGEAFLSVLRA